MLEQGRNPSVGQNPPFPPARALWDLETSMRANLGEPMQEPAGLCMGIWGLGLGKPLAHHFSLSSLEQMMCSREGGCSPSTRNRALHLHTGAPEKQGHSQNTSTPCRFTGADAARRRYQSPEGTEQNRMKPALLPQSCLLSLSSIPVTQPHTCEAISS